MPATIIGFAKGGLAAASALKTMFATMQMPDDVTRLVRAWRGQPKPPEREVLLQHSRRIEERRVFSAPFHSEVIEASIWSLDEVRRFTDEAQSQITHAGARVMLLAILSDVRHFLDKWRNRPSGAGFRLPLRRDEDAAEFLQGPRHAAHTDRHMALDPCDDRARARR